MGIAINTKFRMTNTEKRFDVLILGLGKTGIACARFFSSSGKSVAIADSRYNPPGLEAAKTL